ncbi:MAG: protein-L-isoaspartate O-methyltransferase [Alphaproteobacteria bacterium]|nr:protein-L-isoaspartate O-methyltransferase [Alphaproteobacteria bacterium]
MPDFESMRYNMVKGQILPEEVTHPALIDALYKVPRERFVPRQLARIAYMDGPFSFNKGRILLRPATLARLLQELNPQPQDKILYVGAGTGYGPALLGSMGAFVVALDSEETLTQEAEHLLSDLNLSSVHVVLGPLAEGWEQEMPYTKIIIEGSIDMIPTFLSSQLMDNGTIVTLRRRKAGRMEAVKFVKKGETFTEISLFDAFAPQLKAFQRQKAFDF